MRNYALRHEQLNKSGVIMKVKQSLLLLVVGLNLFSIDANSKNISQLNWQNTSQYIGNQLACQSILADIEWSHNLWPKANKALKPAREEVIKDEDILDRVEKYLLMESVLKLQFNQYITDSMLQQEINRIAATTRDAKRLRQLFNALGNDATTIAECIARNSLVKKKLYSAYQWNNEIHANTQKNAQLELKQYQQNNLYEPILGEINTIDYVLQDEKSTSKSSNTKPQEIQLTADNFVKITKRLSKTKQNNTPFGLNSPHKIKESATSFYFEQSLKKTKRSIKVAAISWPKKGLNQWLSEQTIMHDFMIAVGEKLYLPKITGKSKAFNQTKAASSDLWQNFDDAPSARYNHSAIWTGNEMIIWGGFPLGVINRSGARYNPVNDSWKTITTTNAPSVRASNTTVWTGTEMIIWGGVQNHYLNTGSLYNPVNDSWSDTTTNNAPVARLNHTAIWTGTEMIIWGGSNVNKLNTGGRYDPISNSWTTMTTINLPTERDHHTSIWTDNEMIIWGGIQTSNIYANTGGRYNPVTDLWTITSTLNAPVRRSTHTAIWSGEQMIIWGGGNELSFTNVGGSYNPTTDSWENLSTTNAPMLRINHSAIWTGSKMIIWGGNTFSPGGVYNPGNNSWSSITSNNEPKVRKRSSTIWTGSEMIIWGGFDNLSYLNTGGRYNPVSDEWQNSTYVSPVIRTGNSTIWTGNEMIIWGGDENGYLVRSGSRYNPTLHNWSETSNTLEIGKKNAHTAIWSGTEMIIWGGFNGTDRSYRGAKYNPASNLWFATAVTAQTPSARTNHTATWTGDKMIIWGGYDGNGINTGAQYNPADDSWQPLSTVSTPSNRYDHTAIWNDVDNELLIWGGIGSSSYIGGKYNPTSDSWTAMSNPNIFLGEFSHSAIWTGTEMIVWGGNVNVGGDDFPSKAGARYIPASNSWVETNYNDAPSARGNHSAIWTGTEMIIWGGLGESTENTGSRYIPQTDSWQATTQVDAPAARYNQSTVWTGENMLVWGGEGSQISNSLGIYSPETPNTDLIFSNGFE